MIKKLYILSLLSIATNQMQAVVAVGDTPGASTTFQFSIGSAIYNPLATTMWAASGGAVSIATLDPSIQKYGISYTPFIPVDNASSTAVLTAYPYLTSTARLSQVVGNVFNVSAQTLVNPLLGQEFSQCTLIGAAPAVVLATDLTSIYYIEEVTFNDNARGLSTSEGYSIINTFSYAGQEIAMIAGTGSANLLSAFAPGAFGSAGSTLSFLQLVSIPYNLNGVETKYLCLEEQASQAIAVTTPVLTANGANLSAINPSITTYSSTTTQIYIGVDVTAGTGGQAVALFKAAGVNSSQGENGMIPGSLTFSSVLPDNAAQTATISAISTVVSTPAPNRVAIRNVTTTTTSTGLSYIIVARDNGVGVQSIYATPMVTMPSTNASFGEIAAFDSVQTVFNISGATYRKQGFSSPIINPSEIDIASSDTAVAQRILVGAGTVPCVSGQYIDQLTAQGDSLYITIQDPFAPSTATKPGMFKSDAIFDETGRIMAWTSWQRVAGTDDQMLFAIKNRTTQATMFVSGATSQTIEQTTWSSSADLQAFITKVTSVLPVKNGGVQAIIPFPNTTPGFTGLPDTQISLVAAMGNNNVIIAQTGQLVDGNFEMLEQTNNTSIILDESQGLAIGSVVAADFGNDSAGNNWLFMGGDGGLSVLTDRATGVGFAGVLPNVGALVSTGQTCMTLGSFAFVKKIVGDGTSIFIMTQDAVYQIQLITTKFTNAPAPLNALQVVAANQLSPNAYCLDMLVDHGVILLGTTAGLYSINVETGLPGVVSSIPIPMGLPSVSCLQAVCYKQQIGFAYDYGFYSSSNLYVLSIDFSTEQARLNRFTITNGVVTPIQDQLLPGQNGPLIIFDYMSNAMFIDGTLGFMTCYKIGKQPAALKYLQYTLQAGISGRHWNLSNCTSNISIALIANATAIAGVARDYASGCLMLAGDFGLLTDS